MTRDHAEEGRVMDNPNIEERQDRLGDDLVWGAEGIAVELDVSIHRARYLIRSGKIPITRISERHIVASRRALRKAFKSLAA
jgi:hypothetical protein